MMAARMWRIGGIAALVFAGACGQPQSKDAAIQSAAADNILTRVRTEKTVLAGWAPYAPYSSRDTKTGKVTGYYIDLFERMAEEGGLKIQWVETTWGTMISDLKLGKFEVMASPVFRTVPRALEAEFTRPIDYFGYSAVVRKGDNRFHSIGDFDAVGVKLAVTQGEVGYDYARRYLPSAQLVAHQTGDIALALVDVVEGRADAGLADAWTVKQFVAAHPDKVRDLFGDHPFNTVGGAWLVPQGQSDWLQFLNTSIDWLESSGYVDRASTKYELGSFRPNPVAAGAVTSKH
jgi:ABC-type amino acid transport substrate-binding protein